MELPEAYYDELCIRLGIDQPRATLRKVLSAVGMQMPIEQPPNFEALREFFSFDLNPEHCTCIPFTARLEAFGHSRRVHLRYLDISGPAEDGPASVTWLQMLIWPAGDPHPEWVVVPIELIGEEIGQELMRQAKVAQKSTPSP